MDKLKIMEAAVRKWERIIANRGTDHGVVDCPPCRIYYAVLCYGCPIAEYTGQKLCKGSPYIAWYWHHREIHDSIIRKIRCPECIELAGAMRDCMAEIAQSLRTRVEDP